MKKKNKMTAYHTELSQLIDRLIRYYQTIEDDDAAQTAEIIKLCHNNLNHLLVKLEEKLQNQSVLITDLKAQANRRYENRDPSLIRKYQAMAEREVAPEYAFICAIYNGLRGSALSDLLKEVYSLTDTDLERIRSNLNMKI